MQFHNLCLKYNVLSERERGLTSRVVINHNLYHSREDMKQFSSDSYWTVCSERAVSLYIEVCINGKNVERTMARCEVRRDSRNKSAEFRRDRSDCRHFIV